MADEPVRERIVERPSTTVVERRGSGVGVILGIIVVALIALAAYFLFVQNENRETNAVVGAAEEVGDDWRRESEEFRTEANRKIDENDAEIERLKAKANLKKANARAEYEEDVAELRAKNDRPAREGTGRPSL